MFAKYLLAIGVATAIMGGAAHADYKKIRKEADFRSLIVGKKVVGDNGFTVTMKADGSYSGSGPNNSKIQGQWVWSGRYWCRSLYFNGKKAEDDCQTWAVDGNKYMNVRDKGKGKKLYGTLK